MRKYLFLLVSLISISTNSQEIAEKFKNPPPEYRPQIFWDWMHDMITREGITSDLESFKKFGLSGTLIMIIGDADAQFHPLHNMKNPIKPMSQDFFDAWKFAAEESSRLGLTISSQFGPGWCHSGGPWIKPDQAIQHIDFSEIKVVLDKKGILRLLLTYPGRDGNIGIKKNEHLLPYPGGKDFTQDIALLAYPATGKLDVKDVVDLSEGIIQDVVERDFPSGTWIVRRYAIKNANALNRVAPAGGVGLESDKLDKDAVQAMYQGFVGRLVEQSPGLAGKTIRGMEADSWEVGNPEWSKKFTEEFTRRRGYNPVPWIAFLKNDINAVNPDLVSRFKNDVYLTQNDLFADNFFTNLYQIADAQGMQLMTEPYYAPFDPVKAGGRVHVPMGEFWARGDCMNTVRWASSSANTYDRKTVAAEAFTGRWSDAPWNMDPYGLKRMGDLAFCNGLNMSILHGTALQPWGNKVKPGMPMAWWGTMFLPGQTWFESGKAWTDYLSRCQYLLSQGKNVADIIFFMPALNWKEAIPTGLHKFYNYDVATEELLSQGMDWRDGYFILKSGARYKILVLPKTGGTMEPEIISRLIVLVKKGGTVICQDRPVKSASLTNYPQCDTQVIKLADELWGRMNGKDVLENKLGKGKIVWIENLYRQKNDPESEWALKYFPAPGAFYGLPAHTTYWSEGFTDYLKKNNIAPDVEVTDVSGNAMMWGGIEYSRGGMRNGEDAIGWIHRRIGSDDVYFISNQTADAVRPSITFNLSGKTPELWIPETGKIYRSGEFTVNAGRTILNLELSSFASLFVVFKDKSIVSEALPSFEKSDKQIPLDHVWSIKFPAGLGAPDEVSSTLKSLADFDDTGVKYFSGTSLYTYQVEIGNNDLEKAGSAWMDLGKVRNIAEININGMDLATIWKPPFCTDILSALKAGENLIRIKVTNTWFNRLVGDEQQPGDCEWGPLQYNCNESAGHRILRIPDWVFDGTPRPSKERYTFTTWKFIEQNTPLIESGLIGPVFIKFANK
jgi:hypothetical protein